LADKSAGAGGDCAQAGEAEIVAITANAARSARMIVSSKPAAIIMREELLVPTLSSQGSGSRSVQDAMSAGRKVRIFLVGVSCLLVAAVASCTEPETQADRWSACMDGDPADARRAIAACTVIIDGSGASNAASSEALRHRGVRLLARALSFRGNAYLRQGDLVRAAADFNSAVALEPNSTRALVNRAKLHMAERDLESALPDLDKALSLDPRNADTLLLRGEVYYERRDWPRAIADFDAAAQLQPRNAAYENQRCWTRAVAGLELDIAREACDEGIRLSDGGGNILDSRGLVGLKQGRFAEAWADYDAAHRTQPDSAHYVYGRGLAALKLGRTAEGRADLARAVELDGDIAETYAGYGVAQ
jgi:tetratricopeptide (TPR) repeat protein